MKKIKQILGVVAVFLLVVGCYSQTLQAKELTNSEMIEDSNMELYGQAKFLDDDSIQLTPLETNSSGCVWYPHSVDTTQDFSITVSYWIYREKRNRIKWRVSGICIGRKILWSRIRFLSI